LLPSKELRDLTTRIGVCLSGPSVPEGCDIRYCQSSWVLVFDTRGELLAAADLSNLFSRKENEERPIPKVLVEFVDDSIAHAKSLEAHLRDYVETRGSEEAFAALGQKLSSIERVGQVRVARRLEAAASCCEDPIRTKCHALLLRADACGHQVIDAVAFGSLQEDMVTFLERHPEHRVCRRLVEPCVQVALRYSFDLRGYCEALARRWIVGPYETAERSEGAAWLATELRRCCKAEVTRLEAELAECGTSDHCVLRCHALLGRPTDVLVALNRCSTVAPVLRPIYGAWRAEAEARLAQ